MLFSVTALFASLPKGSSERTSFTEHVDVADRMAPRNKVNDRSNDGPTIILPETDQITVAWPAKMNQIN